MLISSVDDAIVEFGTCGSKFPHQSIRWALDHWHEAAPRLIRLLEDCASGVDRSETTKRAVFFVAHLLAEKRETQAFGALCLLVENQDLCEDVLSGAITETLKALLVSTWDGDAARLKHLIEADAADEFVRAAALDALTYLTKTEAFRDDETRAYLVHLAGTMQPRSASFVWTGWAGVAANLGYADLREKVAALVECGFIEPMHMNLGDFDIQLQRTLDDPTGWAGIEFDRIGPFTDTIGTLSTWASFAERTRSDPWSARSMPHVDPLRKVGRNDPCPCGSGKKYKKCCLQ
jgi:hypothetical protein